MPFALSDGIICGPHRGSFAVRDHWRSNLWIICGLGIICRWHCTELYGIILDRLALIHFTADVTLLFFLLAEKDLLFF